MDGPGHFHRRFCRDSENRPSSRISISSVTGQRWLLVSQVSRMLGMIPLRCSSKRKGAFFRIISHNRGRIKPMPTRKDEYIQQEVNKTSITFTTALLLYGCIWILPLGALDYFAQPQLFSQFFLYRVAATLAFICLYLLIRKIKKHADVFIVLA